MLLDNPTTTTEAERGTETAPTRSPPRCNPVIRFTTMQAAGYHLGKCYTQAEDGTLMLEANHATLYAGSAQGEELHGLAATAEALDTYPAGVAITHGVVKGDDGQGKRYEITTKANQKANQKAGRITRTADCFEWNSGAALLFVDLDFSHAGEPARSLAEAVERVRAAHPVLNTAAFLARVSSSSGICSDDGRINTGIRGIRAYIVVADGRNIPALGRRLTEWLWLAGEMGYLVGKRGQLLERGLIDTAVWQPERLDFLNPNLGAGLYRDAELVKTQVWEGEALQTLPPLSADQKADLANRKAAARAALAGEVHRVKRTERRGIIEAERAKGATVREAVMTARRWDRGGILPPSTELFFQDGRRTTAGELVAQCRAGGRGRWNGARLADPYEPTYRDDGRIASLRLGSRDPAQWTIHSYAHGETVYRLPVPALPSYTSTPTQGDTDTDTETHTCTRANVGDRIAEVIRNRAEPGRVVLIIGPPGMGKTQATKQLKQGMAPGEQILLLSPTGELSQQAATELGGLYVPGRQVEIDGEPVCLRTDLFTEANEAGYHPRDAAGTICQQRDSLCPHWSGCTYMNRRRDAEEETTALVVGLHNHLQTGLPGAGRKAKMVIIDELPAGVMERFSEWRLDEIAKLLHPGGGAMLQLWNIEQRGHYYRGGDDMREVAKAVEKAVHAILAALEAGLTLHSLTIDDGVDWELLETVRKGLHADAQRRADEVGTPAALAAHMRGQFKRLGGGVREGLALAKLLGDLLRLHKGGEAMQGGVWIKGERGQLHKLYTASLRKIPEGLPLVILDATGNPDLYAAMFPAYTVETHNFTITDAVGCEVVQIPDIRLTQGQIGNRGEAGRIAALGRLLRDTKGDAPIVGQKALAEALEGLTTCNHRPGTFGALRGLNRFSETQTLLLAGRILPPPHAVEARARCYWGDGSLETTGAWMLRTVGMAADGVTWQGTIQGHKDTRIESILRTMREDNLHQGAGRGRYVHGRAGRRLVVCGAVPVPTFEPDRIVTGDAVPPLALGRLFERWGGADVLPMGGGELGAVPTATDTETENATPRTWAADIAAVLQWQAGPGLGFGYHPTLTRYRTGNGRYSTALVMRAMERAEVLQELRTLLGGAADLEPVAPPSKAEERAAAIWGAWEAMRGDGQVTRAALQQASGVKRDSFYRTMRAMEDAGQIERGTSLFAPATT